MSLLELNSAYFVILAGVECTERIMPPSAASDPIAWCVRLSVCHVATLCKMAKRIEVLFGVDSWGTKVHCLCHGEVGIQCGVHQISLRPLDIFLFIIYFFIEFMHCFAPCSVQSRWFWWSHWSKHPAVEIWVSNTHTETCHTISHVSAWRHGMCTNRLKQ